jgi:hypothetical protein
VGYNTPTTDPLISKSRDANKHGGGVTDLVTQYVKKMADDLDSGGYVN